MATISHDCGTDVEKALRDFGTHRDLPANRRSAAEAIARHAVHRQTEVTKVYWEEYEDERIRPVFVHFADGTRCKVSWGWVSHYDSKIPGSEFEDVGEWTTWLPENRRRLSSPTDGGHVPQGWCACMPGLLQPVGSPCSFCEEPITGHDPVADDHRSGHQVGETPSD